MKKIFLILLMLCAMALSGVQTASAGHFGIQGGASFMGIRDVSYGLTTGYHAGLTYKFKLPLGFAIQPSLLYHMKSSAYDTGSHSVDFKVGYGLGLGGGLEIWKIQLVCRYNWNFGSLLNQANKNDVFAMFRKELNDKNFGGVTLSVAFLF